MPGDGQGLHLHRTKDGQKVTQGQHFHPESFPFRFQAALVFLAVGMFQVFLAEVDHSLELGFGLILDHAVCCQDIRGLFVGCGQVLLKLLFGKGSPVFLIQAPVDVLPEKHIQPEDGFRGGDVWGIVFFFGHEISFPGLKTQTANDFGAGGIWSFPGMTPGLHKESFAWLG